VRTALAEIHYGYKGQGYKTQYAYHHISEFPVIGLWMFSYVLHFVGLRDASTCAKAMVDESGKIRDNRVPAIIYLSDLYLWQMNSFAQVVGVHRFDDFSFAGIGIFHEVRIRLMFGEREHAERNDIECQVIHFRALLYYYPVRHIIEYKKIVPCRLRMKILLLS
jgi:hypothetical protein